MLGMNKACCGAKMLGMNRRPHENKMQDADKMVHGIG